MVDKKPGKPLLTFESTAKRAGKRRCGSMRAATEVRGEVAEVVGGSIDLSLNDFSEGRVGQSQR